MTDKPKTEQEPGPAAEQDDLSVTKQTIGDLDVKPDDAGDVKGGAAFLSNACNVVAT